MCLRSALVIGNVAPSNTGFQEFSFCWFRLLSSIVVCTFVYIQSENVEIRAVQHLEFLDTIRRLYFRDEEADDSCIRTGEQYNEHSDIHLSD